MGHLSLLHHFFHWIVMHNSKHTTKTVELLLPILMFKPVFRNRGSYNPFFWWFRIHLSNTYLRKKIICRKAGSWPWLHPGWISYIRCHLYGHLKLAEYVKSLACGQIDHLFGHWYNVFGQWCNVFSQWCNVFGQLWLAI